MALAMFSGAAFAADQRHEPSMKIRIALPPLRASYERLQDMVTRISELSAGASNLDLNDCRTEVITLSRRGTAVEFRGSDLLTPGSDQDEAYKFIYLFNHPTGQVRRVSIQLSKNYRQAVIIATDSAAKRIQEHVFGLVGEFEMLLSWRWVSPALDVYRYGLPLFMVPVGLLAAKQRDKGLAVAALGVAASYALAFGFPFNYRIRDFVALRGGEPAICVRMVWDSIVSIAAFDPGVCAAILVSRIARK